MALQAKSSRAKALIDGLQTKDHRLYQVLKALSEDVSDIYRELHPIQSMYGAYVTSQTVSPELPAEFTYEFLPYSISFTWTEVAGAALYELRRDGSDWDTATFLVRTPSLGAVIDPLLEGSYVIRLKTINAGGMYSGSELDVNFTVTETPAPVLTGQVIDNNVLLYWTVPASLFAIDHYEVRSNGVKFADLTGTFIARYETVSGDYTYSVRAIDTAGNAGTWGQIILTVKQPPDFTLLATYLIDAGATKTNFYMSGSNFLGPVDLTEQFGAHFTSHGWASPADQVAAGYADWIQENLSTGSIIQEFNTGVVQKNLIITVTFDNVAIDATVTAAGITVYIAVAGADHVFGSYTAGASQFFTEFQYLKVKLDVTDGGPDKFSRISNAKAVINVKREVDSNDINCVATDATGTIVYIDGLHNPNLGHGVKQFKDVDSITLAAKTTEPVTAIYDFVDAPNPTSFKILLFDAGGRRVDGLCSWKVRGSV